MSSNSSLTNAQSSTATTDQSYAQIERDYKKNIQELRHLADSQYKITAKSAETAAVAVGVATTSASREMLRTESRIELDVRDVVRQAGLMQKRINDWAVQYGRFNDALKELGDVGNWSYMVQSDIQDTVKILDAVVKTKRRAVGMDD